MSHAFRKNRNKSNIAPGSFLFYATQASECEQIGKYVEAKSLWDVASRRATAEENKAWASARHDYCERVIRLNGQHRQSQVA